MPYLYATIIRMPAPSAQRYGPIPGVDLLATFKSRREVYAAGLHRALQAGIVGDPGLGAESIVMSGGYPDDEDRGYEVKYTGHGGQLNGRQVQDQGPADRGNAALIMSIATRPAGSADPWPAPQVTLRTFRWL
ncbi:YDG/SRA domain-containing protein [Hamadaea sp. NPDC050747]|uniref:YDG/SRA domain-containing protein n=1 Tax=Hamadaea sp. NPDC050747 TaxID=3155789 RepID=UPI0033F61252